MYIFSEKNFSKIIKALIFFFFLTAGPFIANAAALSVSPASGNFEVGNHVTVRIIATSNTPLNAVSGSLSFPSSIFSIESVSKAGSILNFWVTEPIISGSEKTVKFEGVSLGGFPGPSGTVLTINLRAISAGSGSFSFKSGQILANDGEGTDITGNLIGATFSVAEAAVKPKTPTPEVNTPIKEVPKTEEEIVQPEPTLKAPEIILSSKYGNQAILGTSDYGSAQALVTFVAPDGTKIFILGAADNKGEFTLLVPDSLKRGLYTVTAVMIQKDKTNSETSNVIVIKVGSIFSDITYEVWILILLLIIAILYLIIRTYVHFKKDKNLNQDIKHEVHEAEKVIHQSFDLLREDIIDYDNAKLTATEHNRMLGIKKDITAAEKVIDSKVKDIESR